MSNKKIYLWDILKLNSDFDYKDVDEAYRKLDNKTQDAKLAWKVLRDKYYSDVYKKYLCIDKVNQAGFILDNIDIEDIDYYNLDLLSTPVGKILDNMQERKNPIVLLTTGGFDPIHKGHLYMMEEAKRVLEENGYNVVGGYFSPSHDVYVRTKPYNYRDNYERVAACQEVVKDSNWLMIDPWECTYVKTYINFTDVISRLELYLNKHVNPNIRVAYVCGADNAQFMYCFENNGIGICVERDRFNDIFNETKNNIVKDNIYFIDNKTEEATYSSRDIRKKEHENLKQEKYSGVYAVRNEGTLPLANYISSTNREIVENAQKEFMRKLIKLFRKTFNNDLDIETIDMIEQLKNAEDVLGEKKTISLDTYFRGTHNIEISRLFDISDLQKNKLCLTNRLGHDTIPNQISKIENGNYILVDDDCATGSTIRGIMELLPKEVKIDSTYMLSSMLKDNIFDIVDLRDFIIGAEDGGLVVRLPNREIVRAPYVFPYVSLKTRASIRASEQMKFSIEIWKMNKEFYSYIDRNMKLSQTGQGFIKLMKYIGFNENDLLIDICDWHINKLQINRGRSNKGRPLFDSEQNLPFFFDIRNCKALCKTCGIY
jgi:cytidyltransferase-like protein